MTLNFIDQNIAQVIQNNVTPVFLQTQSGDIIWFYHQFQLNNKNAIEFRNSIMSFVGNALAQFFL